MLVTDILQERGIYSSKQSSPTTVCSGGTNTESNEILTSSRLILAHKPSSAFERDLRKTAVRGFMGGLFLYFPNEQILKRRSGAETTWTGRTPVSPQKKKIA